MTLARATVRCLRTGIVPPWEIERLSVAYQEIDSTLTRRCNELIAKGACGPLFVRGEWGTGKSHLLSYLRAMAARRNLAYVSVTLNPRSAALNYPQRFYPTIVESIVWNDERGLRSILHRAVADRSSRHAIQTFAESSEAGSLSAPLRIVCARYKLSEGLDFGDESAWSVLLGADLAWSTSKRPHALRRIRELCGLLRAMGAPGLIAVFDEAESIGQLFNRLSRAGAYETLGSLCQQTGMLCVFGITARFDHVVNGDVSTMALFSHLKVATEFLSSWKARIHSVIEPPQISASEANRLAHLVGSIYRDAYPNARVEQHDIDAALAGWRKNPHRNPRRLVRAVVDSLDAQRPLVDAFVGELDGRKSKSGPATG